MAEFTITVPQLGTYTITAPDEETAKQVLADELQAVAESDDPKYSGLALNTTAGLNQALYNVAGFPVDMAAGAINLGARGINAVAGTDIPMIPEDSPGRSGWIAEQAGKVDPVLDPRNTVADSTAERIARGVGEGIGYTVAPEAAVAGGLRLGVLKGKAADILARLFGRGEAAATNAVVGGVSGGGAVAGMEAAPEGWEPVGGIAGGLGAGTATAVGMEAIKQAAKAGTSAARNALAPFTEGGRTRLAGEQIRDNATDFNALKQSLDDGAPELVPGSDPTTFQATGDMGVGGMERGAAARNPDVFNTRRAAQNTARVKALTALQADGAPETVAAAVRQQLKQIDDDAQRMVDDALTAARRSADGTGTGANPEVAGETLRKALSAARESAKAAERELWQAVDPDGTLAIAPAKTKARFASIMDDMPASAKSPSGEERAIYDTLEQYGDAVPLREVNALSSRLTTEMRAEKIANGQSPAYRRMTILKGAIEEDLQTAVAGKVADEAQAVKSGAMDAEQTIIAKLLNDVGEWQAQREATARQVGGAGSAGTAPGGPSTVSGSYRAEGPSGGGPGGASRDPRLSADAPNLDEAALGRLKGARQATKDRVDTYDNKTLSPIADGAALASSVPDRVFVPGAKGFETVQTYRKAVGDPEAMEALQGFIVDKLRNTATRADGSLDPRKVTAFRTTYKSALRAFPELDAKFADAATASQTLDDVAKQSKAVVSDANKGVVGRVAGLEDPADVTRSVGRVFAAQDSAQQMLKLRNSVGSSADGKKGLRKAVVEFMTDKFVGNTEAGTTGTGTMKSDQFQTFIKTNKAALRNAGFTDAEIGNMTKIADDLQRANRSIASVKNPGGSNTAQDTLAAEKANRGATILAKVMASLAAPGAGGTAGYVVSGGSPAVAIGTAIGAGVAAELRRHGLQTVDDIVTDALLNPERARILLRNIETPAQEASAVKQIASSFTRGGTRAGMVSLATTNTDEPKRSDKAAAEQAIGILLGR